MSGYQFRAFWPVRHPETARADLHDLISEAVEDLPAVAAKADAVITGTPRWGILPGVRWPGAGAHRLVLACIAPAECAGRRAYLQHVNELARQAHAEAIREAS